MVELRIRLDVGFSRSSFRWALVCTMLLVCAPELGSETVTLSTYYPAPSGVYTKMITTRDAWLARDGGNVGIGTLTPAAKLDVNGIIRTNSMMQIGNYDGDPAGGVNGALYYNTTIGVFRGFKGGSWGDLGGGPWTENVAANTVYLSNTGRKIGIGPAIPDFPAAPLDVNGTIVSRQTACTAKTYSMGSITPCGAGNYASAVVGVMSKYQLAALYDMSPGEDVLGNPLPPVPTGRMWCCPCPGGACPSL
jgi:hypothetical protein